MNKNHKLEHQQRSLCREIAAPHQLVPSSEGCPIGRGGLQPLALLTGTHPVRCASTPPKRGLLLALLA